MSKPEIGTKRQCTNCGAKYFDLRKSPIVCPKCGAVYQVAGIKAREVFQGATKPVPETEVENSEVELVSLSEVEEREDKVAGLDEDDLEVEAEPTDAARLPEEEEELTGDISPLINGDLTPEEEG
jgi:uncharacterized protein (TIGR02300 family)